MSVTTLSAYVNHRDNSFITVRNKTGNNVTWVLYVNGKCKASKHIHAGSADVVKQFGLNPAEFIKIN